MTNSGTNDPEQKIDGTAQLTKDVHWITHATFWSQVGLGIIGIAALCIYGSQLRVMKGQMDQMTTDSRPWIKITDIELTQESFATFDFPKAMPPPIEGHGVTLRVKIKVKNVGHGVARSIVIRPLLIFERLTDTKEVLLKSQEECVRSVGPSAPEGFTFSSVFPEEYREQSWVALGVFAQSDINTVSGKNGKYLIADLVTCVGYQYPMPYLTRAAAHIMGDKDRFLEVGVPLRPPNIRLLRDDDFEYAQ